MNPHRTGTEELGTEKQQVAKLKLTVIEYRKKELIRGETQKVKGKKCPSAVICDRTKERILQDTARNVKRQTLRN